MRIRIITQILFILTLIMSLPTFVWALKVDPILAPPLPETPNDLIHESEMIDDSRQKTNSDEYTVTPILFVPADVTPNPHGLAYVDRHMQYVQRWYAEQMRGRTFTLRPAQLIIGEQARTAYFGPCYPPGDPGLCSWGYEMWNNIFAELDSREFNLPPDQVQGVFFQGEGMSTALGGGRRFVVGFGPDNLIPDCIEPGCAYGVSLGGAAHELGHALGLGWHPFGSPEAFLSVMSSGFYDFPQITLINTDQYPERDVMINSGFMNVELPLANPGFEACLDEWQSGSGQQTCLSGGSLSGINYLRLTGSNRHNLRQIFRVSPAVPYDVAGWVRMDVGAPGAHLRIEIKALDEEGNELDLVEAVRLTHQTPGWIRFAQTINFPEGTIRARWQIVSNKGGIVAGVDHLSVIPAQTPPPMPLPATLYEGSAVSSTMPQMSWSPVAWATDFEVQVAGDALFENILATGKTDQFQWQTPVALPIDEYSFWRVRAVNGAGSSAWSPVWSVIPRSHAEFYDQEFQTPGPPSQWTVLRYDPSGLAWPGFVSGRKANDWLVIDMQPGDLNMRNDVRNIVLRSAPEGDFEATTLIKALLDENEQQAGLIFYQDDDNYVKISQVFRDGWALEFEAEKDGVLVTRTNSWHVDEAILKLVRKGNDYSAAYSNNGLNWIPLGGAINADWEELQMGLTAYSASANYPYAAFNWLRVGQSCLQVTVAAQPKVGGQVSFEGATCEQNLVRSGSTVRLTAVPAPGYHFDHWQGAEEDANPLMLPINEDRQITAIFVPDSEPNQAPVATDDAYQILAGSLLIVDVPGVLANDNDPDGNALTAHLVTAPGQGDLVLAEDGSFTFLSDEAFAGEVIFTYLARDGELDSAAARAVITVLARNQKPQATGEQYEVQPGQTLVVDRPGVLANDHDPEGQTLQAVLEEEPAHGDLALEGDGSFVYMPDHSYLGPDSFKYYAWDGETASEVVEVSLNIKAWTTFLPVIQH